MKSYKCFQCSLTNWVTDEFCKRCRVPNPHLKQDFQNDAFNNARNFADDSYRHDSVTDYSSPPPPNVFGNATGTASVNDNFNYQNNYRNRPPFRGAESFQSPETAEELSKAEKQIRNAWIAGIVVCVITGAFSLIFATIASKENVTIATPFEMLFSVVIFGGLTIGVYYKSRACAVLLCVLFILDKIIAFASTGRFGGGLLAFVFIYYFAYGIQGTFTYQKLKKQGF